MIYVQKWNFYDDVRSIMTSMTRVTLIPKKYSYTKLQQALERTIGENQPREVECFNYR
jgi:hypothetical protein